MRRRDFIATAGTGFLGLVLGGSRRALAQAGGTPGVSTSTVKIGMSAAFLGHAAGLGTEYYRGSMACYQDVNAAGGIYGRQIEVVALDDGYEPVPTIRNTIQLVEQEQVFFLSNYVGTPTLTRALPVIKRYSDEDLFLVGNFTGAQPQREPPYVDQVFNIRASYRQEMIAKVDKLWELGLRRFGVFYQIDAYGRSGTDGVARGLSKYGTKIAAEATYRRGTQFDADLGQAIEHLRQANVEAVLCTGAYQSCGAFIRNARERGWTVPITNVSFVGCDAMLSLLVAHERATGKPMTGGLVNSQVVPSYADTSLPAVQEYQSLIDRWKPDVPAGLRDPNYTQERYSFISFEGFLNAKVIVEGLRKAGPELTRVGMKRALESLDNLDIGIGAPIQFGPDRHQGLDRVYFTTVNNGRWVPIADWRALPRV